MINCEDCQLFEDKYYPCTNPGNEECNEFFPNLEVLYKYMWILTVDVNTLITFVDTEAKKQKNYILDKLVSRLKKEIERKSLSVIKNT